MYTDSCNINVENVSDLLNTGDMFFLPGQPTVLEKFFLLVIN
jgi:hypothetical protein